MAVYQVMILALVAALAQTQAAEVCAGCPVQQDPSQFPTEKLHSALSAAGVNDAVAKVLSVKTQVVAGLKYEVVYESTTGKTCTATWIDAPWESKLPIGAQVSCRAKRSLLGGFTDVDASEAQDVESLSEFAANSQNNGNRKVVVQIVKAQKKVVNGLIYKVKYLVKTTACKSEDVPTEECLNQETAPKQVCESMFYTIPYLTHGAPKVDILSTECKTVFNSA